MTLSDVMDPWVALYIGLAAYFVVGLIVSTRACHRGVQGSGDPFFDGVRPSAWERVEFWIAVAILWVALLLFWPIAILFQSKQGERPNDAR